MAGNKTSHPSFILYYFKLCLQSRGASAYLQASLSSALGLQFIVKISTLLQHRQLHLQFVPSILQRHLYPPDEPYGSKE